MANKQNKGILYYTVDTDMPDDEKIQLLCAEHGKIMGLGFITLLLSKLYREGYYYDWNERSKKLFAFISGLSMEQLDSMISTLLEVEFINNRLFKEYGIITSKGIQERYIEATRKRKEVPIVKNYWLVELPSNNLLLKLEPTNTKAEDNGSKSEVSDLGAEDDGSKAESSNPTLQLDTEESEARRNTAGEINDSVAKSRKQGGISPQRIVKDSIEEDSNLKQTEQKKEIPTFSMIYKKFPKSNLDEELKDKATWERFSDEDKIMAYELADIYLERNAEEPKRSEYRPLLGYYISLERFKFMAGASDQYREQRKAEKELAERQTDGDYILKNPDEAKMVLKYIKENLPLVSAMKYQMNLVGADSLCYDYGYDKVIEKLIAMENWEPIKGKDSVVNVCRHWLIKAHGVLVGGKDPKKVLEMQKIMSN